MLSGAYLAKQSQLVADLAAQGPRACLPKVTPSQSGHHREVTRTPPSSAKSQCGAPPTAPIPKTRDQPENAYCAWTIQLEPAIQDPLHPTHAFWMNFVEVWFGNVERQAIRRGVFKSVKDLNTKIRAFIDGWNDRSYPSSGPRPPNKSSRKPTVQQLRVRATSVLRLRFASDILRGS
jgi:hypothetical protein